MTRPLLALGLALWAFPLHAQAGLRLHAVVSSTASGDTTGVHRAPLATAAGGVVHLGAPVLEVPLDAIQTVGLEEDEDGTAVVSVWLDPVAALELARTTEDARGQALAVVHEGRVVGVPRVEGAVANGLILLPGLAAAEAARLAADLRGESTGLASPPIQTGTGGGRTSTLPPAERLPMEPAVPSPTVTPLSADGTAQAAALAFVRAVAARQWGAAVEALHPDALDALRPDALGILRLDGPTVWVRDGIQEASFTAADVLGRVPDDLEGLAPPDLASLHFAGLDALGVWGPPDSERTVVGRVDDGELTHVVLRGAAPVGGMSVLSVVTVRRDDAGRWRVLLTDAQGF
ncbi:SecDF P1 head subdomain-containing protein [Rubrivirga marina]|uniref:SecDF P1 head subdomain domain-containing protein n=1 Tax=Rubrivirga marina TaxID=1196024 RepID=A0A271J306_9BACT|nr:hypothetical protein [Rubrivirga marina]PAP77658.1 hypothetical protein BSZ37_15025 [Rubrivirga marina]